MSEIRSLLGTRAVWFTLVALGVVMVLSVAAFQYEQVRVALTPNDEITANFDRGYKLREYVSDVKIAGVPVGVVTKVEPVDGEVAVTMALDRGELEKLGAEPSAHIRPTTLLGGNLYVDLLPGGSAGEVASGIPVERTQTPVELDAVLEAVQPDAQDGVQTTLDQMDEALGTRGQESIDRILGRGEDTLQPTGDVLTALRGREGRDLRDIVGTFSATADELTRNAGQLEAVIGSAGETTKALGDTGPALGSALDDLPATLTATRSGLGALDGSLDRLEAIAGELRPSARNLNVLLAETAPVLPEARDVLNDVRPLLADLQPTFGDLTPTAGHLDTLLGDVDGRVLDRVRNPITTAVMSNYRDEDALLYETVGYMFAGLGAAWGKIDEHGGTASFQPGFGTETLSGLPFDQELLFPQRPLDPEPTR